MRLSLVLILPLLAASAGCSYILGDDATKAHAVAASACALVMSEAGRRSRMSSR